ncbi:hypothetical protein [Streptomyces cadmiisoli]|uniref:Uncharacterized protein n=1 Tax=Streptomyces cadmiisoli TaxID=2184053 RepID=A0A2Z4J7W3_9ACTN|nr:hypothetical protein [Streptomyces cadmiisoli]AWW41017.1 hypothetical protein DN051_33670 [Streptomyces cadmiisoli]
MSEVEWLYLWADVQPGEPSAEVSVPTVEDTVTEPEESTRIQQTDFDNPEGPQDGPEFTGRVTGAP